MLNRITPHGKKMKAISAGAWLALTLALVWLVGCNPEKPLVPDGQGRIEITVLDSVGYTTNTRPSHPVPVQDAQVYLTSQQYLWHRSGSTDQAGKYIADGLPVSHYHLNVSYSLNPAYQLICTREIAFEGNQTYRDSLYLAPQPLPPLLINEVYYCGPPGANGLFFDQFIELVNPGDTTVYLDGKIIGRCAAFDEVVASIEQVDYVTAVYAFRFPGEPGGRTLPVPPGSVVVLAGDAMNFQLINPNSVNLEYADFEFYNQFGQDMDNPAVPNLENMIYEGNNDFLFNRKSDALFIADGAQWKKVEMVFSFGSVFFLQIPLRSIIDAVEYKASSGTPKILTRRLDAGYAGVGITSFSGKSIQRCGLQDFNDSSVDFQILNHPTPFVP